jgi:hypothetical protein
MKPFIDNRPTLHRTRNEREKNIWALSVFYCSQLWVLEVEHDAVETKFRFTEHINDQIGELITPMEMKDLIETCRAHMGVDADTARAMILDPPAGFYRRVVFGATLDIRDALIRYWNALTVIVDPEWL